MAPFKPVLVVCQLLFVFGAAHRSELSAELAAVEVLEHGLHRENAAAHRENATQALDEAPGSDLSRESAPHLPDAAAKVGRAAEALARTVPDDHAGRHFAEVQPAKFDHPAGPLALLQEEAEVSAARGRGPPAPPAAPSDVEGRPGADRQPRGLAVAAAALPEESASAQQARADPAAGTGQPSFSDALKLAVAAAGDGRCPVDGPFTGYGCGKPGCKCSWWPIYGCYQPKYTDIFMDATPDKLKAASFGQCVFKWYVLALILLVPAVCCALLLAFRSRGSRKGGSLLGRRLSHEAPPPDTAWLHRGE